MVNKKYIYLPIGILTTVTALAAVMLTSTRVMATCTTENGVTTCDSTSNGDGTQTTDTAVKNARVTVSTACSFYDANDSYTNTKSATLTAGSYDNTTFANFSNIQVTCNDAGGFAVYAIGNSSEDDTTRNMMIGTSGSNINTGLYTSGNTASSWSMRLTNAVNGVSFTNNYGSYHAVPASYEKVATSSAVSGGSTKAGFTTNYDVFPGYDIPAGTYTGSVKYVVVNPSSTVYPPAVTIDDIEYMQDFATDGATIIASMTPDTQYQLKDNRDQKTYYISKVQTSCSNPRVTAESNGNCYQVWMTQNLDLDLVTTSNFYTHDNTDLGWDTSAFDATKTWTAPSATSTSMWSSTSSTYFGSYNPGDKYYRTSGSTSNDPAFTSCTQADCPHYHAGNYYTWNAAVANNLSDTQYDVRPDSICPAGWKLPVGMTSSAGHSDFNYLLVRQGIISSYGTSYYRYSSGGFNKIRATPLFFVRSGYVNYGSLNTAGSSGSYWSSSVSSSSLAYDLYFDSSDVGPAGNISRYYGYSVRCVAR